MVCPKTPNKALKKTENEDDYSNFFPLSKIFQTSWWKNWIKAEELIIKSQNHFVWKRPLRSLSTSFNTELPSPH